LGIPEGTLDEGNCVYNRAWAQEAVVYLPCLAGRAFRAVRGFAGAGKERHAAGWLEGTV
jgi:hypothetical protein